MSCWTTFFSELRHIIISPWKYVSWIVFCRSKYWAEPTKTLQKGCCFFSFQQSWQKTSRYGMMGIKNICDIWQESALVGDEFHLKALPSLRSLLLLLSKLRGERRLQTWSSSRRWQVTMSLSLPSASSLSLSLSLTLSFNVAMICNYHKLEQYFKRLMNLSNPNILFYENIKYLADS